jgi:phosphate transport system substrate-binding protein
MFNRSMWKIARTKLAWGALMLVTALSAHAGTTLVGGGSTTVSIGYLGPNAYSPTTLQFFGTPGVNGIASGSLLGVYMAQPGNPSVSYCETGDQAGKDILAGRAISGSTYNVQNSCTKSVSGLVTGFGASFPEINRTDLSQPNFVASDSPLNTSDLTNYQANHGASAWPTQFPAVASAIAIAFNLEDNTGAQVNSWEVNFSDTQLCEIFSGLVTNWADINLASAFTLPAGHMILPAPINVIYRSDGSGGTFGLSNHLSAICPKVSTTSFGTYFQSHFVQTSQNFAGAGGMVSGFFPVSGGNQTLPTGWAGFSGDESEASAIESTVNSIGYVSMPYALAMNPILPFADVDGLSPTANFGTSLAMRPSNVVFNEVLSTTNAANGQPVPEAISNPPSTQCIALIPPSQYAVASTGGAGGTTTLLPPATYPIVTVSYLLGNAQGNAPADLVSTRNLVDAPYNSTISSSVTTMGPQTGTARLIVGKGIFLWYAPGNCLN